HPYRHLIRRPHHGSDFWILTEHRISTTIRIISSGITMSYPQNTAGAFDHLKKTIQTFRGRAYVSWSGEYPDLTVPKIDQMLCQVYRTGGVIHPHIVHIQDWRSNGHHPPAAGRERLRTRCH